MITTTLSFERNSNSWHIYIWATQTRMRGDGETTEACWILTERDVPLGGLEAELDGFGSEIASTWEMHDCLNMYPRTAAA